MTRAQARRARVSDMMLRRLVTGGWIDRAAHGVYRMRGAHDLRWTGVWVAWLSLDPVSAPPERVEQPTEVVRGPTAASAVYGMGHMTDTLRDAVDSGLIDRRDLPGALAAALGRALGQGRRDDAELLAERLVEAAAA